MSVLITIIHVVVSLVLIIAVLLQSGKAADLAGAFGGGGSQSAFGPRGGQNLLSRVTTACAVIFMLTSLGLWIMSSGSGKSALSGEKAAVTETTEKQEKKPAQTDQTTKKEQTKEEGKDTS
ncbi:MAG TPA: preprotein translocase subunit SecG, partial [Candidatus Aminicenantes bacterium]|nr:preprotein translocase subunit SecG [Candidatus Aminicenantes bacterium]